MLFSCEHQKMGFWCCSFLLVTCVHIGVIFCSLYFLSKDFTEGSQPCPQGRGSLSIDRTLLKSVSSRCKMEEHSSALHCLQQPDQCRSLGSQREHICHTPSILSFYSVWFRCGLVRPKYLDIKGMWKRGNKNFQATWYYIFTQKRWNLIWFLHVCFLRKSRWGSASPHSETSTTQEVSIDQCLQDEEPVESLSHSCPFV